MNDTHRLADVKVGIFVLAALAIVIAGSLWIAGATFFGATRVVYRVRMPNSSGVAAGDRVRFAGVAVGRIQQVSLSPGEEPPVIFQIAVRPEVPVTEDSWAKITTAGLLGTPYLEIVAGSPDAPRLPPGGEIRGQSKLGLDQAMAHVDEISGRAVDVMDKTAAILDQVSAEIGPMLANLNRILSEDNAGDIRTILSRLSETLDDAGPRLSELLTSLQSSSEKLDRSLDEVPGLTSRLSGLTDDLSQALGPDGQRLARLLDTAQQALDSAGGTLGMIGEQRPELEATLRDLRDTAANLKAFSQQVKERPFSLVRIKAGPDRRPGEGVSGGAR